MKEQLRTEAEKVLELNNVSCSTLKNAQSLDGKGNWLDKVIDAMIDFHAQQSKERDDNFIKAIELLSLIQAQYYDVNSNVKESVSQLITTLTK